MGARPVMATAILPRPRARRDGAPAQRAVKIPFETAQGGGADSRFRPPQDGATHSLTSRPRTIGSKVASGSLL
jgi:hypothetical protein